MSKRSKHQAANALTKKLICKNKRAISQYLSALTRASVRGTAYMILRDQKFIKSTSNLKGKFVKLRAIRTLDDGRHISTFFKTPVVNGGIELPWSLDTVFCLPGQTYKEACGAY